MMIGLKRMNVKMKVYSLFDLFYIIILVRSITQLRHLNPFIYVFQKGRSITQLNTKVGGLLHNYFIIDEMNSFCFYALRF